MLRSITQTQLYETTATRQSKLSNVTEMQKTKQKKYISSQ